MKKIVWIFPVFLLLVAGSCRDKIAANFHVVNLKCEYMADAVVVKDAPRFSWELQSPEEGQ